MQAEFLQLTFFSSDLKILYKKVLFCKLFTKINEKEDFKSMDAAWNMKDMISKKTGEI